MMKTEIAPQPGCQVTFLSSPADIAIIGGSAGCGKSFSLLMEPVRHVKHATFGATVFRRSYPEITMQGGLWDESESLYPLLGARPNLNDLLWRFPSGAEVGFRHLQNEAALQDYHGAQIPLLLFDELQSFTEKMFFYMLSRNRSGRCPLRSYLRGSCNPDPDSFLRQFIDWWIASDGYADLSRAGKVRYFYRSNDILHWADEPPELMAKFPEMAAIAPPKSVAFIPGTIWDNKKLLERDPGYLSNLQSLSLVEKERLLGDRERGGNWNIRPSAGKVFNRGWFEIVDAVPAGGIEGRGWDFAATEKDLKSTKSKEPAYTASVKMRYVNQQLYILDCTEERVTDIDDLLKNTSRQDAEDARQKGVPYRVRFELEPGSAAIREGRRLVALLAGIDSEGKHSQGDKLLRAAPLGAQARVGNVKILRGAWNERFLKHLHNQPDWPFKDIMDAASLIASDLMGARKKSNIPHSTSGRQM